MGLMCFNCEDQYPSGILDKNGYDVFGQAVSGKVVTGEVRFDCLNCGRTVVRSLPSSSSPTRLHWNGRPTEPWVTDICPLHVSRWRRATPRTSRSAWGSGAWRATRRASPRGG